MEGDKERCPREKEGFSREERGAHKLRGKSCINRAESESHFPGWSKGSVEWELLRTTAGGHAKC